MGGGGAALAFALDTALISYTSSATRQVDVLTKHYERNPRDGAVRALYFALDEAERVIERDPAGGLAAPRPSRIFSALG